MGQLHSIYRLFEAVSRAERHSFIDALSDEEVEVLIEGADEKDAVGIRADDEFYSSDSVVDLISHDAVHKRIYEPEAYMMAYVSSHTTIPVPRIRRILQSPDSRPFNPSWLPTISVVMDRIDGEMLLTAWPKLSWWKRIRIIWCIRSYVRQLQSMPLPYPGKPGPFDEHDRRHFCPGRFFTLTTGGPFESYDALANWYDRRRFDAMVIYHQRTGKILQCPKFDRTQPLVLCHGDLCMQNIIIDREGIPWLIDFGESGVYPAWFEYANAANRFASWRPAYTLPPWWYRWGTPFMFGNYGKYLYNYLNVMGRSSIWSNDIYNKPLDYFSKLGIDVDSWISLYISHYLFRWLYLFDCPDGRTTTRPKSKSHRDELDSKEYPP